MNYIITELGLEIMGFQFFDIDGEHCDINLRINDCHSSPSNSGRNMLDMLDLERDVDGKIVVKKNGENKKIVNEENTSKKAEKENYDSNLNSQNADRVNSSIEADLEKDEYGKTVVKKNNENNMTVKDNISKKAEKENKDCPLRSQNVNQFISENERNNVQVTSERAVIVQQKSLEIDNAGISETSSVVEKETIKRVESLTLSNKGAIPKVKQTKKGKRTAVKAQQKRKA